MREMKESQTHRIESAAYGSLQVSQEQIYDFSIGLVGLAHIHAYALLPYSDTDFFILHSLTDDLSFILIPAHRIQEQYAFEMEDHLLELLGSKAEDIMPFLIVNIVDQVPYMNLKAPILLAPSSQKGCQFVLNDASYAIRTPLILREDDSC